MMWRKFLIISVVLALSMVLLTQPGWAICEQQDLEGNWTVRVGTPDGFGRHWCWADCNMTISSGGIIEQGGTHIDCLGVSSEITGGQLTISLDCGIEGTIITSNGTLSIATGAIVGDEIVLGMDED